MLKRSNVHPARTSVLPFLRWLRTGRRPPSATDRPVSQPSGPPCPGRPRSGGIGSTYLPAQRARWTRAVFDLDKTPVVSTSPHGGETSAGRLPPSRLPRCRSVPGDPRRRLQATEPAVAPPGGPPPCGDTFLLGPTSHEHDARLLRIFLGRYRLGRNVLVTFSRASPRRRRRDSRPVAPRAP
jgi:hypothetical protein